MDIGFVWDADKYQEVQNLSKLRAAPEARKRHREAFRARLINHVNMELKHAREIQEIRPINFSIVFEVVKDC